MLHDAQVAEGAGDLGVVGAVGLLHNREHAGLAGLRLLQLAALAPHAAQVAEGDGDVGVVGAKQGFGPPDRVLEHGLAHVEVGLQHAVATGAAEKRDRRGCLVAPGRTGDSHEMRGPVANWPRIVLRERTPSLLGYDHLDGVPTAAGLLHPRPGKSGEKAVQHDHAFATRPLQKRQIQQAVEGVGEAAPRARVIDRDAGAELQQPARDRHARGQPGGAREQLAGERVHLDLRPQPAQADLEGARHIALVARERAGALRRLGVLDRQRDVREQIRGTQLGKVGCRDTGRFLPVAGQVAAGQFEGERQVAEFVGDRFKLGVVQVRAMAAQQGQAFPGGPVGRAAPP